MVLCWASSTTPTTTSSSLSRCRRWCHSRQPSPACPTTRSSRSRQCAAWPWGLLCQGCLGQQGLWQSRWQWLCRMAWQQQQWAAQYLCQCPWQQLQGHQWQQQQRTSTWVAGLMAWALRHQGRHHHLVRYTVRNCSSSSSFLSHTNLGGFPQHHECHGIWQLCSWPLLPRSLPHHV
jgi:hypothetical protein